MILYTWYRFDYYENATAAGKLLYRLGKLLHIPLKKAYRAYEKLCSRYSGKETEFVCDTVFIRHLKKNTWRREWFQNAVYLPFENRMIPVPEGYDGRLKTEYGDYMKPAKAPTYHGGLTLDPDVPYTEYRKEI
jgi:lipopolysaccharide cholinephosphotransferase